MYYGGSAAQYAAWEMFSGEKSTNQFVSAMGVDCALAFQRSINSAGGILRIVACLTWYGAANEVLVARTSLSKLACGLSSVLVSGYGEDWMMAWLNSGVFPFSRYHMDAPPADSPETVSRSSSPPK